MDVSACHQARERVGDKPTSVHITVAHFTSKAIGAISKCCTLQEYARMQNLCVTHTLTFPAAP
jgi:hypothetical protein